METSIVTKEDMNYLMTQSTGNINMIISGMTALLNDNQEKATMLESQTWFQRMTRTITGKNKMTQEEIRQNHEKINIYMTQALTELYKQNCIDHQIMMSLGNQMNELYAEQLQLKQMIGAFVTKLNEKIDSIDNFHMLTTEIEQGVYSQDLPFVAVCKILPQLDRRLIQDSRKMDILYRDLENQRILNSESVSLEEYLLQITNIPLEDIGAIYLELQTIKANYMSNLVMKLIESYHFLPDMARKLKNKQAIVEQVIKGESLDSDIELSITDIYREFVESKMKMYDNQLPNKEIQNILDLENAEKLYLNCKLEEAFDIFQKLADDENIGRAMYFLGEYYGKGLGKVSKDYNMRKFYRIKGAEKGDVLCKLNAAFELEKEETVKKEKIFNEVFPVILEKADNGDCFAQNEIADLFEEGYGCEKDPDKSFQYLEMSATGGYWWAAYKLGIMYRYGRGVEEDLYKAKEWYLVAAKQGYDTAQNTVGFFYNNGIGGEKNAQEAAKWYKKAADQGNVAAISNLGVCYEYGDGVEKDLWRAVTCYRRAAELGDESAQSNLAVCYLEGRGISKDRNESQRWFRRAADQGDERAKDYLRDEFGVYV